MGFPECAERTIQMEILATLRICVTVLCVLVLASFSRTPSPKSGDQHWCIPDVTNDICAKPIAGCLCWAQGNINVGSLDDCGGCWWSITGVTYTCNSGGSSPLTPCTGSVSCGVVANCTYPCTCNGGRFAAWTITCGDCPP